MLGGGGAIVCALAAYVSHISSAFRVICKWTSPRSPSTFYDRGYGGTSVLFFFLVRKKPINFHFDRHTEDDAAINNREELVPVLREALQKHNWIRYLPCVINNA